MFQRNEELRAQNEYLRERCENLRSRTAEEHTEWKQLLEDRDADYRVLLTEKEQLKANLEVLNDKHMKLFAENSELRKYWNAEREELHGVNKGLRAQNDKLMTKNKELLTKNEELSATVDHFKNQFKEMLDQPNSAVRGDDTSSSKVSAEVNSTEIIL